MLRRFLACTLIALVTAQATTGSVEALYENLAARNTNLYATSVISTLQGAVEWASSGAWGLRSLSPEDPMMASTPGRVNGVAELLVVAAFLQTGTNIDEAINTNLAPNNLRVVNLNSPNTAITYRMLMQHTSSLSDNGAAYSSEISQPACTVATGTCSGAGTGFRTWMESIFSASTTNTSVVRSSLFSSNTPGLADSYEFAHTNTALLAYILDNIGTSSAEELIYNTVIQPLGLSNTFYLDESGQIPSTIGVSSFWKSMLYEFSSTSNNQIWKAHPNRFGDVMLFSSAEDINKIASVLLAPADTECVSSTADLCSLVRTGRTMRETSIAVTSNARTFQTTQGLGIQFFDPVQICEETVATGIYTECPLSSGDRVWGYMTGGTATDLTSIAGVICTDSNGLTSAVKASCVSIVQGFRDSGVADATSAFATVGGAYQDTFGEVTVVATAGNDDDDDLYGLWVCLGVVGTIGFVVAASYFTEFLIQPPPPVGPGPFRPGQPPHTAGEQYQGGY